MKEKYAPAAIALSLIAIAVTLRILPHPANFAPVGAVLHIWRCHITKAHVGTGAPTGYDDL